MRRRLRKIRLDHPEAGSSTLRKKHAMIDTMLMLALTVSAVSLAATRVVATLEPAPVSKAPLVKIGSRGC
jgi:hypothetical protein